MALHFTQAEFDRRRDALLAAIGESGSTALLLFQQESMYWLTGYDTFGFCFFQCLVLKADGAMVLLTRSADLRQAQHTSIIAGHPHLERPRRRQPGARPARPVAGLGLPASASASSTNAGLTAANGRKLDAAFDGFGELVDASDSSRGCALVK